MVHELNAPLIPRSLRLEDIRRELVTAGFRSSLADWLASVDPSMNDVVDAVRERLPEGVYLHHINIHSSGGRMCYGLLLSDNVKSARAFLTLAVPVPEKPGDLFDRS
jgi:hypothetical protein